MRPRISIRGSVRPSVGPSVRRSVGRSVTPPWKSQFLALFSREDVKDQVKHSLECSESLFWSDNKSFHLSVKPNLVPKSLRTEIQSGRIVAWLGLFIFFLVEQIVFVVRGKVSSACGLNWFVVYINHWIIRWVTRMEEKSYKRIGGLKNPEACNLTFLTHITFSTFSNLDF